MTVRTHRRSIAVLFAAALSISGTAKAVTFAAVDGPATPATTSTAVESLQVTISGVQGNVQVREAEDQPWKRATVGMVVGENAEFRTSLRSAVQIQMEGGQVITLDRLGTIKVMQAVNDSGKFKTKIGMKYGRTRYD